MAGIASLFTREFFEGARARLAPGGVLCQWAHTYDISDADLRSIVATFLSVFPDGTLWLVGDADVLLVGSTEPLEPRRRPASAPRWQRPGRGRRPRVGRAPRSPFAVLSLFVADGSALKAWAAGAPLQTDDRRALEFSGPRSIFGATRDDNAGALRALAAASPKPGRRSPSAVAAATARTGAIAASMLLEADGYAPALRPLRPRSLELNPAITAALDGLIRAAVPLGQAADGARRPDDGWPPTRRTTKRKLALSRLLASQGNIRGQRPDPRGRSLQPDPGNVPALEQLASILADIGDAERLAPVVARLRTEAPESTSAHYYAATLAVLPAAAGHRHPRGAKPPSPSTRPTPRRITCSGPRWRRSVNATRRAPPSRPRSSRSARPRHVHQPRYARDGGRQPSTRSHATSPKR